MCKLCFVYPFVHQWILGWLPPFGNANMLLWTWVCKYLSKRLLSVLLSKGCKAQEQDVFEGQFLMTHPSPLRAGLTGQKEALLMA